VAACWRNAACSSSVATYLRCGGVVNNQIKKDLLLSLPVKKMCKIGKYLAKLYTTSNSWLSRALCGPGHHTTKSRRKCMLAYFSDIVSQSSVTTHMRCGGIFNKHLVANLLENLTVKFFENRLRINRVTSVSLVSPFFGTLQIF